MRVVAVVLSVDEAPRLQSSLPPAVAQADDVLVVDNACTDATADVAARCGARVLRLPRRVSYAAAINAGLAAAGETDALLLLNADCVLDDGFVAAAAEALAADGVGSVAPLLLRSSAGEEVDAAGMTIDRRRKNSLVGHGEPAARWSVAGDAFGADGACALYRREVLEALGPEVLDEDLELWATDADLAWRARALGWRCAYAPAARARHVRFYSPTTRPLVPAAHRRLQFRNRLLVILKNERPASLLKDLPRIAAYEVLALGYALLREPSLLPAYWQAARLAPRVWGKRRSAAAAPVPFGLRPP
ncbi:MAG: glycosyltransferase family 2 protein [Actinobacteria bacterium]|nr:MAG: glycosyltransferase family 2 protein [Actinomycetota bacterium]